MTTAVAVREPNQPHPLRQALEGRRDQIAAVLPDGMSVDRFIQVAWLACAKNPDLLACTPASILSSIIEAAEVGLEPTGSLSRAWLIPYDVNVAPKGAPKRFEKQAQLQIGYQGLADLARNSGQVTRIESRVVYQDETFVARYGTNPGIDHLPTFETTDPTKIEAFYAIAYFPDGSTQFDVMTRDQVDGIRARSRAGNFGPWVTDYAEMGRKTVTRRLMKSLPLSPETQSAVQRDIEREVGQVVVSPGESQTAKLRRQLQAKLTPQNDPGVDPEPEVAAGATVPAESAEQQTEDAVVVCGNVAGPGPIAGAVCLEAAEHQGPHRSLAGSWPA
jgi:recombination protein RecT